MNAYPMHRNAVRAAGFSLVELMVALVLGLILMGGVISVFITSKSSYSLNNAVGAVQESGRFAMGLMAPNIRMAGFMGCAAVGNGAAYSTLTKTPSDLYDFSNPVEGYDAISTGIGGAYTMPGTVAADTTVADWAPAPATAPGIPSALITSSGVPPVKGSDMFVLHEAAGQGFYLQPNGGGNYVSSGNVFLLPADAQQVQQGQVLIVSDCKNTVLSQATNTPGTSSDGHVEHSNAGPYVPGNNNPIWPVSFSKGAQLFIAQAYVYYIGVGKDLGPSLYMVSLGVTGAAATPVELVSGVENMQVLYGVDTDGDKIPNVFVPADVVYANKDWANVVSLRIALVTQSDDNSIDTAPATAATYTVLDPNPAYGVTLTAPKDRRLRRVFQETISIRNKLP